MIARRFWMLLPLVAVVGCKDLPEKQILGKWRSVRVENAGRDEFFRLSKALIDTIGVGHTDEENMAIYGLTNMDSVRMAMRAEYDSAYAAQVAIETNSVFHFKADSEVVFSFPGRNETGRWYIDDKGELVIEEINADDVVKKMAVAIRTLTANEMKLTFTEETGMRSDTSVVTFEREKK
jgi:hypothetical protein